MKKVVLASLLACAAIASGLPSASAQTPVSLGTQAPGAAANAPIQMDDAELAAYTNAKTQPTPQAQATAFEAYLVAYPQSQVKVNTLEILMNLYSAPPLSDLTKTLGAADRILKLDPNNLQALYAEAVVGKASTDAITDPAAKQAAYDTAASYAQKALTALAAPKPADMTDAAFTTLKTTATPTFYAVIAAAALNKKDGATAVDAYKKELASVPLADTQKPSPALQDTYYLGLAYLQSTPPDLLNCAYYVARFIAYAPAQFQAQYGPTAHYCYKKYHGGDDGFDAMQTVAKANLNPPADFAASVKPAPTPAEQIHTIIAATTDYASLATSDKEMVFQYGSPEDAAKVWDSVKGKSSQFPDVLVIESSPTVIKVAVDPGNIQSKTADFTFNMAAPEDIPEPKPTATPAAKLAYKKAVAAAKAKADAVTAATAVGATVTLTGTYDSFTPNPVMIVMKDGDVVLPKAAAAKPAATHTAAKPPVHRAPAH
jgi:hypothetical protein